MRHRGRDAALSLLAVALASLVVYSRLGDDSLVASDHVQQQSPPFREARARYSGLPASDGLILHLDRVRVRRGRRSAASVPTGGRVRGVARDCGESCVLRLRGGEGGEIFSVHLHRWNALDGGPNSTSSSVGAPPVPIVQYLDGETHATARTSRVAAECMYRAVVPGAGDEHSVVNLCEHHGGMSGLLALPDGIYAVEPIHRHSGGNHSSRHRPHLLHRFKSQQFRPYDEVHEENPSLNITYEEMEWDDKQARKARSRRSANSWDHFVEVLVVADTKMHEYHYNNLEQYIITLFSTVASIYRHQSLRAAINVVVVKIMILKTENAGPRVSSNAQDTLQQFCKWQQLYNDRNEDSVNHHDVAILLTRGDICRAPGKCDTLGLAELGTMCDPGKSCAIIEDNGLSAAFTIAHELGHVFNIPHDDERRCAQWMALSKQNFHIMAPTLEYNTHPWSWSTCSAMMLEKFLDQHRGQIQCLFDQPVQRRYYDDMFTEHAPGRKYDVDQQCRFVFGPQAELCPYMPSCRRLWCATYYGNQLGCRTQHMPWADGTPCDKSGSMFCHRGECVGMAPERRTRLDGGWGDWQPWAQCSRTCGGGVQKALRDCDNPRPANGGKYCVGERERYRSCSTHECPWDTVGHRELQCAEYNNKDVGIHGVPSKTTQWLPKYTGVALNERCKLYCRVSGSAAFYLLKDKVQDGTPCDRNGDDICVDGTCMAAGCDHRLGSSLRRDKCGICGGDSTTCRTVKGTFNERGSFGYNEVMKIPAGSANIDIRQHGHDSQKDDDNYLSLRSANGEFLLNGHYQVSVFRQQIPIQDVILEYSGSDNVVERINGTGPIRSDIYLHVLSVGNLYPPDIRYEYMVADSMGPARGGPPPTHYYWRQGEQWTKCSAPCQGTETLSPVCVEAQSGRQTSERNCRAHPPAVSKRMCNIECTNKWLTESVGRCSVACGVGEKQQKSRCVRVDQTGRQSPADTSECSSLPRPPDRVSCHEDCAGRRWSYSEWTTCTESCGSSGVSRRRAVCVDQAGRPLDDTSCGGRPDQLERECGRVPCPRWQYGHWSECSRSCDGGVRMRHAQCVDAADRELPAQHCDASHKLDRESCNQQQCVGWRFGDWSTCSVTCGEGVQQRDATCADREGRPLDPARCAVSQRIVQKPCVQPACPQWRLGQWTQCSVSCLDGWSTRRVSCVDHRGVDVSKDKCHVPGEAPPSSHRPCNQGPCPFWRMGDWSACSVSCGSGVRSRSSECVYREQTVDASFCGEGAGQPLTQEKCTLIPCTSWESSPWSSCSVSCGEGVQSRTVWCGSGDDRRKVDEHMCHKSSKPRGSKSCERDPCSAAPLIIRQQQPILDEPPPIRWTSGPWTECSASCGSGMQRRQVVCRDRHRELSPSYCSHLEKPESEQSCKTRECARWEVGQWAVCSATCGSHVSQSRSVSCVSTADGSGLADTDCDVDRRPTAVRSCRLPPCPRGEPPLGTWRAHEWSKCSVTCGGGWRRRSVSCSAAVCDDRHKPRVFDRCNEVACPRPTAAWQISPWTHCSVTCGGGVQRRRVWCEFTSGERAGEKAEAADCGEQRPAEQRDCESSPCRSAAPAAVARPHRWSAGPWSACSAKCGRGSRRRLVSCLDGQNRTVASSRCDAKERPIEQHRCRTQHCPRWRGLAWGSCSVTCGTGERHREMVCQRGRRNRVSDAECASLTRPATVSRCVLPVCPAYKWMSTPWSKCTDACAPQPQTRRVYCVNAQGKQAKEGMCDQDNKPLSSRVCSVEQCPYEWVPGPWNTCSQTCGAGTQLRHVECRVKSKSPSKQEPSVPAEKCSALPPPAQSQPCNMNPCGADHHWMAGPWEQCSTTCGQGVRRRKVRCLDRLGRRVERAHCEKISVRPKRIQTCFQRNCLPSTCQEIRAQNTLTHSIDGEYTVLLDGFPITVYCHRMNETIPRSYINVEANTNYAEIYGKRLIYPHTCPFGGERNDSCQCTDDGDAGHGKTQFAKLRVDLLNRKININDFTFARTLHGSRVAYATAGDCYSMKDCPQGRFSVDLVGTGLRVVDDLQWEDKGHRTTSRIERTQNNARIEGRCGGYCGQCAPDRYKGLVFEVDRKQQTNRA